MQEVGSIKKKQHIHVLEARKGSIFSSHACIGELTATGCADIQSINIFQKDKLTKEKPVNDYWLSKALFLQKVPKAIDS